MVFDNSVKQQNCFAQGKAYIFIVHVNNNRGHFQVSKSQIQMFLPIHENWHHRKWMKKRIL
jgi:hypothetical protein